MKTYCLYHANCLDGFMSAAIVYHKYGSEVTYIPVRYQEDPPHMEPGSKIFIVDFSYPREVILKLQEEHKEVIILDHHKTAQEQLLGVKGALFDMTKSGAMLTWEYLFPNIEAPIIVKYIQDRDLWQFKLPDTDIITKALYFESNLSGSPYQWEIYLAFRDQLAKSQKWSDLKTLGTLVKKSEDKIVTSHVSGAYWGKLPMEDDLVPCVNTQYLRSEIGHQLCKKFPDAKYAVCWQVLKGKVHVSLRADNKDIDVSVIAGKFGGGGHRSAAGFRIPMEEWFAEHQF